MIDVNGVKEYFDYIKEIYLKMFEKILNEDIKSKIINYRYEDIDYDMESEFNIKTYKIFIFLYNIRYYILFINAKLAFF